MNESVRRSDIGVDNWIPPATQARKKSKDIRKLVRSRRRGYRSLGLPVNKVESLEDRTLI